MKKNNSTTVSPKPGRSTQTKKVVSIGIDLGDRTSRFCMIGREGEVVEEGSVATTSKGMAQKFGAVSRCRMGLEVGTHSPWVSRLLSSFGHEVIVANARELRAISHSNSKDDRMDAELLARLGRV